MEAEWTEQWNGTDQHAREIGLQTKMCMMRFVTLYGVYDGNDFIELEVGDSIRKSLITQSMKRTNEKYGNALKKLAES